MARRSQHIPLYEVMRGPYEETSLKTGALESDQAESQAPDPAPDPAPAGQLQDKSETSLHNWLARAGHPVVVRIPKGLIWLIGGGVLVMLILAYWIGAQRGVASGRQQVISQIKARNADRNATHHNQLQVVQASFVTGRSYWVLVELPMIAQTQKQTYQEANRLIAFLKRYGVDARADPVHNTILRVTEMHGFSEGQMTSKLHLDYRSRLAQLGRQWKHVSKGSSDFSSMWPMKYNGK